MLTSLHLRNFKGFCDHVAEFDQFSVVVGRNNAGKSTLIEAIRIISAVLRRYPMGQYVNARSWSGASGVGIAPNLDELSIKPATLFHKYRDPPAIIHAIFSNGINVSVYLGPEGAIYSETQDSDGRFIESRQMAKAFDLPTICILPQIGPLEEIERTLRKAYVQKCEETHLSSRHFRNQLRYSYDCFDAFRDLFQQTWERVRISSFDDPNSEYEEELSLLLSEDGFVAEACDFGHGLQMWLQIVWFLSRSKSNSIVVLDEPDVYMHPEQQSKMIDILRGRFHQCILSTHAPTIIDNCDNSELLRVHRSLPRSMRNVGQEVYEQEVAHVLAEERHKALQLHEADIVNDIRQVAPTVEMTIKVVLFDDAKLVAKNEDDELLFKVPSPGRGGQCTEEFLLPACNMNVHVSCPEDAELYINGKIVDFDRGLSMKRGKIHVNVAAYVE